jgi:cobalt-zinc-cadmium efflux system protein
VKGAFLHMLADAAVSVGVVVAGILILVTGLYWIDPLVSLLINIVIVAGTWSLLRDSTNLALDAVPVGIDAAKVRAYLEGLPDVRSVHDLHIWALSTTQTALTAHLVRPMTTPDDEFLARICEELREHHGIAHTTLQIERGDVAHPCALEPDEAI